MRVLENPSKRLRPESPEQSGTESVSEEFGAERTASSDVEPSASAGQSTLEPNTSSLSTSGVWSSDSSRALLVSLDEASESSTQSSPCATILAVASTSGLRRSTGATATTTSAGEDPATVQRRFRYLRSRIPVRGHSFCSCLDSPQRTERFLECLCGEESGSVCEWTWDVTNKSTAAKLQDDLRTVIFHPNFSNGTAAVRGSLPMREGQHFWEVKMITPVYGTNMMVGVGTKDINMNGYNNVFCSLLGESADSWGLSYQAHFHHGGQIWQYGSMFGQGSLIGIHFDCWHGTLSFFKNRRPLGVACRNLIAKEVYPMLCSTAARSGMRLVRTQSCASSLQYLCCRKIRQLIPSHLDVIKEIPLPPGLKQFLSGTFGWLLSSVTEPVKPPQDEKEENNPPSAEVELDSGSANLRSPVSYQMLSDRDIIFERFVERLHTGLVGATVGDGGATPGPSHQLWTCSTENITPSPPQYSTTSTFEVVPITTSTTNSRTSTFEVVPFTSPASLASVYPARSVADVSNIPDVDVLTTSIVAEPPDTDWEALPLVATHTQSQKEDDPAAKRAQSARSILKEPYLRRNIRKRRTIASPSEISGAVLDLGTRLEPCEDDVHVPQAKRLRKCDTEEENAKVAKCSDNTRMRCKKSSPSSVTSTKPGEGCDSANVLNKQEPEQSERECEETPPFSSFCRRSSTTPPRDTSTPSEMEPEDLSPKKSSSQSAGKESEVSLCPKPTRIPAQNSVE